MPQELLGREITFVSFSEKKIYSEFKLTEVVAEKLHDEDDDVRESVIKLLIKKATEKPNGYRFDFVGLIPVRTERGIQSKNRIAIVICPRWMTDISDDSHVATFFTSKFFKSLVRLNREKNTTTLVRERLGEDFQIYGERNAHLVDCMLMLITDVNRFGIYNKVQHIDNKSKGKANWSKTFKKTKPMIVGGVPVYLHPIKTKKAKLHTEVTQIHKEVYSHCVTYLSGLLGYQNLTIKHKWEEKRVIANLHRKIHTIKEALRRERIQKQRKRLDFLLKVLITDLTMKQNSGNDEVIGITSGGFDVLWEYMLLKVIGDQQSTEEFQSSIEQELPVEINYPHQRVWENRSNHIIDIIVRGQDETRIILADAKNYPDWQTLSVSDVMKQYSYEYAIQQLINRDETIDSNMFIFPILSLGETMNSPFQFLGQYRLSYLEDRRDPPPTRSNLLAIGIDVNVVLNEFGNVRTSLRNQFLRWYSQLRILEEE